MPAGTFNMTGQYKIEAGSTWDFTIPFVDEDGAALDFSAYDTARIQLRTDADATGTVISLGAAASDGAEGVWIVTPKTNGELRVVIEASTSAAASYTGGAAQTSDRTGVFAIELGVVADSELDFRVAEGAYIIDPETAR